MLRVSGLVLSTYLSPTHTDDVLDGLAQSLVQLLAQEVRDLKFIASLINLQHNFLDWQKFVQVAGARCRDAMAQIFIDDEFFSATKQLNCWIDRVNSTSELLMIWQNDLADLKTNIRQGMTTGCEVRYGSKEAALCQLYLRTKPYSKAAALIGFSKNMLGWTVSEPLMIKELQHQIAQEQHSQDAELGTPGVNLIEVETANENLEDIYRWEDGIVQVREFRATLVNDSILRAVRLPVQSSPESLIYSILTTYLSQRSNSINLESQQMKESIFEVISNYYKCLKKPRTDFSATIDMSLYTSKTVRLFWFFIHLIKTFLRLMASLSRKLNSMKPSYSADDLLEYAVDILAQAAERCAEINGFEKLHYSEAIKCLLTNDAELILLIKVIAFFCHDHEQLTAYLLLNHSLKRVLLYDLNGDTPTAPTTQKSIQVNIYHKSSVPFDKLGVDISVGRFYIGQKLPWEQVKCTHVLYDNRNSTLYTKCEFVVANWPAAVEDNTYSVTGVRLFSKDECAVHCARWAFKCVSPEILVWILNFITNSGAGDFESRSGELEVAANHIEPVHLKDLVQYMESFWVGADDEVSTLTKVNILILQDVKLIALKDDHTVECKSIATSEIIDLWTPYVNIITKPTTQLQPLLQSLNAGNYAQAALRYSTLKPLKTEVAIQDKADRAFYATWNSGTLLVPTYERTEKIEIFPKLIRYQCMLTSYLKKVTQVPKKQLLDFYKKENISILEEALEELFKKGYVNIDTTESETFIEYIP